MNSRSTNSFIFSLGLFGSTLVLLGADFRYMVQRESTINKFSRVVVKELTVNDDLLGEKSNHSFTKMSQQKDAEQKNQSLIMQSFVKQWLNETKKPPKTPGAFIHIGKTGGSTLSMYLRNGCHSFVKKPCPERQGRKKLLSNETIISKLTTYYHVPDFEKLGNLPYEFYVVTLRDPLSKFKSIFTFMHPANIRASEPRKQSFEDLIKIYSCFPSLEAFTALLGDELHHRYKEPKLSKLHEKRDCENLARAIMSEYRDDALDHFYWGMSTIHKKLELMPHFRNATILAVRTEHLWEDWRTANEFLGQQNVVADGHNKERDYSNLDLPVSKDVSELGQKRLCLALSDEYNGYLRFLKLSSNLSSKQKQDSLILAQTNCPWLNLTIDLIE